MHVSIYIFEENLQNIIEHVYFWMYMVSQIDTANESEGESVDHQEKSLDT